MKINKITNDNLREFLAELLGTFTLTCIGCASNAYVTVAKEGQIAHSIGPWAWGMALTAAIYVSGGVSGGHVNPAVTLGMASVGKLPWRKVFHYFLGQYIGAFLGAAVVYMVYRESIINTFGEQLVTYGPNGTAAIFGTFPNANVTTVTTLLDQIVAVAFFLLLINAITDERNMACPKGLVPIAIGMTDLGLIVFSFGFNCGAPINPARDFSPRLFTLMAGWGSDVFSTLNYNYFWVPIIGCHVGGIIGSWIYWLCIENHWPVDSYELPNPESELRHLNFTSERINH